MVFMIIIPFLNGYNWGYIPHFQTYPCRKMMSCFFSKEKPREGYTWWTISQKADWEFVDPPRESPANLTVEVAETGDVKLPEGTTKNGMSNLPFCTKR